MRQRLYLSVFGALLGLSLVASSSAQSVAGTDLYQVDLDSGEASRVGAVGDGLALIGLALVDEDNAVGLTTDNELIEFSVSDPNSATDSASITGVGDGEYLIGIDIRPATGELIAVSDASVLYVVDLDSAEATAIDGPFSPELESDVVGFDFNPTVDRIRADVDTTQNLRLNPENGMVGTNPDTGEPTIDGRLAFADDDDNAGATANVVAAGYTNSVADAEETELYVIDSGLDVLALQDPPNDGVLNTVGSLGVDAGSTTAFDITPAGDAYALIEGEMTLPDTGTGTGTGVDSRQLSMLLIAGIAVAITGTAALSLRARAS